MPIHSSSTAGLTLDHLGSFTPPGTNPYSRFLTWIDHGSDPTPSDGYPGGLIACDWNKDIQIFDCRASGTAAVIQASTRVTYGGDDLVKSPPFQVYINPEDAPEEYAARQISSCIEDPNTAGEVILLIEDWYNVSPFPIGGTVLRGGLTDCVMDSWDHVEDGTVSVHGRRCCRMLNNIPQAKANSAFAASGTPWVLTGGAHGALWNAPVNISGGGPSLWAYPANDIKNAVELLGYAAIVGDAYNPWQIYHPGPTYPEWQHYAINAEVWDASFVGDKVVMTITTGAAGNWWYGHPDPHDPGPLMSGNHRNGWYLNPDTHPNYDPAKFNTYGPVLPDPPFSNTCVGSTKGYHNVVDDFGLLVYDWADLEAVALGNMNPNEPQGVYMSLWNDSVYKPCARLFGVSYDDNNGLLYVQESNRLNEFYQTIHVYQVGEPAGAPGSGMKYLTRHGMVMPSTTSKFLTRHGMMNTTAAAGEGGYTGEFNIGVGIGVALEGTRDYTGEFNIGLGVGVDMEGLIVPLTAEFNIGVGIGAAFEATHAYKAEFNMGVGFGVAMEGKVLLPLTPVGLDSTHKITDGPQVNAAILDGSDTRTASYIDESGRAHQIAAGLSGYWQARVHRSVSAGKWYFEVKLDEVFNGVPTNNQMAGIANDSHTFNLNQFAGDSSNAYLIGGAGTLYNGSAGTDYANLNEDDIIQVAFDLDIGAVWFGVNGVWLGGGDPAAGTLPDFSGLAVDNWYAMIQSTSSTAGQADELRCDFGQAGFTLTPPSGFVGIGDYV